MLASVLANINRGKKQKPFKISDFLIQWRSGSGLELPSNEESAQERASMLMQKARSLNAFFGGKETKK